MGIRRPHTSETPVGLCVCLSLVICIHLSNGSDVDTLEVQCTVQHGPGGKLQFQQTTLFNEHVIFSCNGQTLRDQPQQDWVTHAFTQEELEERHQQCKRQFYEHFASFEKIKQTITVSAEILQRRRGCSVSRSGKSSFDEWGVNGSELHIFGKPIQRGTVTYLQCHVTDSDLSGVRIQLTKDGVPLDHGVHHTGPRPNGDGTVQMRVQVKTTIDNSKTYRCEVHSETVSKSVVFDDPSTLQTMIWAVLLVIQTALCNLVICMIIIGCHVLMEYVCGR
ncbi:uncharacterized protein LOC134079099 isoform X2 [Sardina pilchardus]|uniref:uncharacterized protein LOC134079099 isoform X2 n=1 Tax=Sardina pilchardus TaxID=27697 RepID=UPI002E0F906B